MVSNYKITGTDLDDYFYARISTKIADVGFSTAGVDISNAYELLRGDQQIPDISAYSSAGTDLAQLFTGNNSQYTTASALTSTRTTAWNTQVVHHITVTFSSATARTEYFTYGGRIKWSGSRTGGSTTTKNTAWSTALTTAGSIELGLNNTYQNGGLDTYSTIGVNDLTTSWQTVHTASVGGAYSSSNLTIQVKSDAVTDVQMQIIFDDATVGGIDENIDGTLTSTIDQRRHPTITAPSFANTVLLTAGS